MASIQKQTQTKTNGKTGYRIQWTGYDGKRKSKVLYLPYKKVKIIADRLEVEAQEIMNGIRPAPNKNLPLEECTDRFIRSSKLDGRRPNTLRRYENVFKPFIAWFGPETPIQSITPGQLEEYKGERSKAILPVSLNTELRHLKALFSWAVKLDFLLKSPFVSVKLVKIKEQKVRFLSHDEIKSLYEYIDKVHDQRAWDLVTFYLQTGARATEILEEGGFTWDSVKDEYIDIIGKGQKHRRIPLNNTLRKILNSRRHLPAPFPYSYTLVSQALSRRLFKKAEIKNANIHTLRKTAGALLIQEGIDIYRVSKFLGHSSVKVTEQHYVDLLQSDYTDMSEVLEKSLPSDNQVAEPKLNYWHQAA